MSKITVSVFIDSYHPQKDKMQPESKPKDGKCRVSIRVTYQRKRKYYPTKISLPADEFHKIMNAKRRSPQDNKTYKEIRAYESKALAVVESMPVFTFLKFEEMYLENREAADSVSSAFNRYIAELKNEKRVGTAASYESAKYSIEKFRAGLKFADITPELLKKYENWMIENGKSKTTIGIYLRSLRTIFNRASIDKSLYPFGEGKNKYSIPEGRNIKKALTLDEISKIFKYKPQPNTNEEMARDYWIFIYLCNGLNMKDLCLLKRKNIEENILTYERAKTIRSKKITEKIVVSLKPEAKTIIAKLGQLSLSPDSYIFPHLYQGMTAEKIRDVVKQLTKTVNKYMKRIAKQLEITKPVTTYFARHSFASVLKRAGVSTEFISEALGHTDLKTTKAYLAGFEEEMIHKTTDALTAFR